MNKIIKIDFFIVGFQKCATTTLKEMLASNYTVSMHDIEELTHFIFSPHREFNERIYKEYYKKNSDDQVVGAKSVSMGVEKKSIAALKRNNPECKLILIVRNPVKRAYSAYWYARRMGWETELDFGEAINKKPDGYTSETARRSCNYLVNGLYGQHISNIYNYFDKNQVKVFVLEEDVVSQGKLYADVCDYLNIQQTRCSAKDIEKKINQSAMPRYPALTRFITNQSELSEFVKRYSPVRAIRGVKKIKENLIKVNEIPFASPTMDKKIEEQLESYFKEDIELLENQLNRTLDIWKSV